MASDVSVIVYGGGAVFREGFNAIAAVMGGHPYAQLIKLSLVLAGVWVILDSTLKRDMTRSFKFLGAYLLIMNMLLWPKATVHIIDRVHHNKGYAVDNVPVGLAELAHLTSTLGDGLTQLLEANFSLPDDLRYHRTGMVMASKLVSAASQFQITDPRFARNVHAFMDQCVFYDLYLGKYTVKTLLSADHLWSFMRSHASPARAFRYNGHIVTCREGAAKLTQRWQSVVDDASTHYAQQLFPIQANQRPNPQQSRQLLMRYLPVSYRYLTGVSDGARTLFQRQLVGNALQNSLMDNDIRHDNVAALRSFAFTKAQQHKRLTNWTMGDMAAYWLPLMKIVFELLLYASFILIVPLSLFPMGGQVLKNYIYSLIWVQAWAPLYAILNFIVSFYAQHHSLNALGGHHTVTLAVQSNLAQVNDDMASLAGYLSMSIPFLATGLVKGMAGTLTQMAQYIGGVTQSAAVSAAGEAASGNISLGNLSVGNQQHANHSAFHWDTAARAMSGHMTSSLPGGGSLTTTADGHQVLNTQGAMSQLGTQVQLGQAMRDSATHQAESAQTAAFHESQAALQSQSAAFRQLDELGQQHSHATSNSQGHQVNETGGFNHAANTVHQASEEFAQNHNLNHSQARQILGAVSMEGSLGGKKTIIGEIESILGFNASIGGRGEKSYASRHEAQQLYNDAQQVSEKYDLNSAVEHGLKASRELGDRAQDDESNRMAHQISASLDQANTHRQEAQSQHQLAEHYRTLSQWAEDHSTSINANATQQFMDWLQHQPDPQGSGRMGMHTAESLIAHDPETAQHYAQQFVREETQAFMAHQANESAVNADRVGGAGHLFDQQVGHAGTGPEAAYQAGVQQVQHRAGQVDTGSLSSVAARDTDEVMARASGGVDQQNQFIHDREQRIQHAVHQENQDYGNDPHESS